MEIDVEGSQGPGDASIPTPIDEPIHDTHAEASVGFAHNVQVQGAASSTGERAGGIGEAQTVEASKCGLNQDKVITSIPSQFWLTARISPPLDCVRSILRLCSALLRLHPPEI